MPKVDFEPPYSGTSVPGFGETQTHTPNTYVTPVNDTVVIPDLNPLPVIAGTDVIPVDNTITTYKLTLQNLAQWLNVIIPTIPFNPNITPGNWNPLYQFQYFNSNQNIAISTMEIGAAYGFYASGSNVMITFTGGTLIGYTNAGTTTTQILITNQVYYFTAITSSIVALINAETVTLEDPTNSNALTLIQNVINNIYNIIPLQTSGIWIPTDISGAELIFTINNATYLQTGKQYIVSCFIIFPINSSSLPVTIGGFPGFGELSSGANFFNLTLNNVLIELNNAGITIFNSTTNMNTLNGELSNTGISINITYYTQ